MSLAFLTLHSPAIEETARLYRLLGMEFVEERHGSGPVHLAAVAGPLAFEIYPGAGDACTGMLLGFAVADLDGVRDALVAAGIELLADIETRGTMRRLIARDADGRRVLVYREAGAQ